MSKRFSVRQAPLAMSMALVLLAGVLPGAPGTAYAAKPSGATDPPQPTVATSAATALAVSAGEWFTCAIRADTSLGCWGYEEYGEATPPDGSFVAIAAGSTFSCAIAAGGELVCWGDNSDGMATPPAGLYTTVRAGADFSCAIGDDGLPACWGSNDYRQVLAPAVAVKAIDAGSSHACAIRAADDTLVCWGANREDQAEPPSGTYLAVDAGDEHTCAVESDGDLVCWGYNGEDRSMPPAGKYTSLSVGYAHACAIKLDGTVACWGDDESGQATPPPDAFKVVTAGYDHTCGIRTDDTLTCWGNDDGGQVTPRPSAYLDGLAPWSTKTSVDVHWGARAALASVVAYDVRYQRAAWNGALGSSVTWQSLTPSTSATLAASAGSTYCFMVRAHGADGNASEWNEGWCTVVPLDDRSLARSGTWTVGSDAAYFGGTFVRSSTTGAALARTGVVASWVALLATTCPDCGSVGVYLGTSTKPARVISLYSPVTVTSKLIPLFGEDDETSVSGTITLKVASSGKPVTIDGLLATRYAIAPDWADASDPPVPGAASATQEVLAVSTGSNHTCAIRSDGTLGCWGNNSYGKAMPPAGTFTALSAGHNHTCAIRDGDDSLACWGYAGYEVSTPPEGAFTDVAAGWWDSCALAANGSIACWGAEYGADGYYEPPPGTFTALTYLDGATWWGDNFCGTRQDGTLDCWGDVFYEGEASAPSGTFTAISGTCGILTGGSVSCWASAELDEASPGGTFKAITTGSLHACGIESDDTITCWGDNEYLEATAPTGTFVAIDSNDHHTCAITTLGTLACWGQDRLGQVTPRPVAAMSTLATWLTTRSVALSWRATSLPAIATYDVHYRRAPWNGSFGAATPLLTGVTGTAATPVGAAGSTYCYAARAHDTAGGISAWSGETCTAIPLDDRSLTKSSGWTAGTGASYYNNTYLRATKLGSTLTRTRVVATRLALVATTCPTCGSVKVYWNGTYIKTISLVSSTTVYRKVFSIKTWTSAHTGTLKIKVSSSGKRVIIDGVVIRRI